MTSHPYQFLPPLSDAEYDGLRADIAANGMRHPIIVDERGKILDGHHRAKVAAELGLKPAREVVEGLTEQEKRDLAFTLNSARRHMDQAQRRVAVIASLKADPQLSDRQHGRRTGVSHPTVASIRAELVAKGDVESLSTRTDSAGRQQPASRPQTPAPMPEPEPEASTSTGSGQTAAGVEGTPLADGAELDRADVDTGSPVPVVDHAAPAPAVPVTSPGAAGVTPDPLDDPEQVAETLRLASSARVAQGLVSLYAALHTDPIRWVTDSWRPNQFMPRDLPFAREAFTADGLRCIAASLDALAVHLDKTGASL